MNKTTIIKILIGLHFFCIAAAALGIIYAIFAKDMFYMLLFGGVVFLCLFGLGKLKRK